MKKQTQELINQIDNVWRENNLSREGRRLSLWVTAINDEDPGIRYSVYHESQKEPICNLVGFEIFGKNPLRLFSKNPLFYQRAVRKAEQIAMETWTYYISSEIPATILHHNLRTFE